jgi:hypothetical protein
MIQETPLRDEVDEGLLGHAGDVQHAAAVERRERDQVEDGQQDVDA